MIRRFAFLLALIAIPAIAADKVRDINIRISGGDYIPASVKVKKGEKVRLNFTRDGKPTCGDELMIPSLKLRKSVPVNKTVSVEMTPAKAGDITFTCGMSMMKGKIVVR